MNLPGILQQVPETDRQDKEFKKVVGWWMFASEQYAIVDNIAEQCKKRGLQTRSLSNVSETRFTAVLCDCPQKKFEKIVRAQVRFAHDQKVWQNHAAPPDCRRLWARHFSLYVMKRWYDSTHSIPSGFRGPNAFNPELLPLVEKCKANAGFNLNDPLAAIYWMEYLAEYSQRRKAWRKFEKKNGPCAVLSFAD